MRLRFKAPRDLLPFTGERFVSSLKGGIQHAHHHRYLAVAQLCYGKEVLDVACGEGYGTALIAEHAKTVVGVDNNFEAIDFARRNYARPNVIFSQATAEELPFPDHSFDLIISFETIEHVQDANAFLDEVKRVLRSGGTLVISSPNIDIYSKQDNYNNPFHTKEFTIPEFESLLTSRFRNVSLFAQERVTGSVVFPVTGNSDLKYFVTSDGLEYTIRDPEESARYVIAIASEDEVDGSIASALNNVTYSAEQSEQLNYYKKRYESLRQEQASAEKALSSLDSKYNGISQQITDLSVAFEAHMGRLSQNIDSFYQQAEELSKTNAAAIEKAEKSTDRTLRTMEEKLSAMTAEKRSQTINDFVEEVLFPVFYRIKYSRLRAKAIIWWLISRRCPGEYACAIASASSHRYALYIHQREQRRKSRNRLVRGRLRHPFSRDKRIQWYASLEAAPSHYLVAAEQERPEPLSFEAGKTIDGTLFRQWVSNAVKPAPHSEHVGFNGSRLRSSEEHEVRLIAYYLPQFHPIPENDEWWGTGFTEWRNVARAFPIFDGHYQPRVPADLGYYDLRAKEPMGRQVELAAHYGIDAFCFHFYWFAGKTLLETPIQRFYEDKALDIKFCLSWANENWSRRWDGSENQVLISQNHSLDDSRRFLEHIRKYLEDDRYLKVDGKPVLSVYRPSIIPDLRETIVEWRKMAAEWGLPGIYLIATNAFGFTDYKAFGFDALSEFPPHNVSARDIQSELNVSPLRKAGRVRPYDEIVENMVRRPAYQDVVHPGVMMGWDNSARKPDWGDVIHGATPTLFKKWLTDCFARASRHPNGERLVFVNAWNEWAEGTYLEPDAKFGHAYLSACADVIWSARHGSSPRPIVLHGKNKGIPGQARILVCGHHAGSENWGAERSLLDVLRALAAIGYQVILALPEEPTGAYREELVAICSEVQILPYRRWHDGSRRALEGIADLVSAIRENEIDLVYVNTGMLRAPLEAARYANVPSLVHLREILEHDERLQAGTGLGAQEILDILCRSTDVIVANSAATLASVSANARTALVPNIVNTERYHNLGPRNGNGVVFGIVSSNLHIKGIADFIEVAKFFEHEYPNVNFEIIGPENGEAIVEYTLGKKKLPKNVTVVGYLDDPAEIYSRLDVVLNLSWFQESFGRTVLEAMAAGRPVVAYDWGALPELVVDNETGLLVPFRNVPEVCNAVRKMLNSDFRRKCAERAAERGRELSDFNWYRSGIERAVTECLTPSVKQRVAGKEKPIRVDVVICVHNALEDVRTCLNSVVTHREIDEKIIIVDDGSDYETRTHLDKFAAKYEFVTLLRNHEALGYTKAANLGASASSGDVTIFLNSDTVVTSGWATKLSETLFSTDEVAIVGPMSNAASYQSVPDIVGRSGQTAVNLLPHGLKADDINKRLEELDDGSAIYAQLIHGFCFAVKRSAWEQIGQFDAEAFPRGYGEENDYCFRAVDKGFGLRIAGNTYVYHAKSKSYSAERRLPLAEKAQSVLYERYGRERFQQATLLLDRHPRLKLLREAVQELYDRQNTLADVG